MSKNLGCDLADEEMIIERYFCYFSLKKSMHGPRKLSQGGPTSDQGESYNILSL